MGRLGYHRRGKSLQKEREQITCFGLLINFSSRLLALLTWSVLQVEEIIQSIQQTQLSVVEPKVNPIRTGAIICLNFKTKHEIFVTLHIIHPKLLRLLCPKYAHYFLMCMIVKSRDFVISSEFNMEKHRMQILRVKKNKFE